MCQVRIQTFGMRAPRKHSWANDKSWHGPLICHIPRQLFAGVDLSHSSAYIQTSLFVTSPGTWLPWVLSWFVTSLGIYPGVFFLFKSLVLARAIFSSCNVWKRSWAVRHTSRMDDQRKSDSGASRSRSTSTCSGACASSCTSFFSRNACRCRWLQFETTDEC